MKLLLILILAISFNAFANILLKLGMRKHVDFVDNSFSDGVRILVTNPFVVSGIVSFGVAFLFYSSVLSKMNLSIAYPIMTSMGFLIVTLASVFLFKEQISFLQYVGIFVIVVGVWLVSGIK